MPPAYRRRWFLYGAALEATAMGVRHNVEAMVAAGGDIRRIVAVGGGTQGELWAQIVSDVTGRTQGIPTVTIVVVDPSAGYRAEEGHARVVP